MEVVIFVILIIFLIVLLNIQNGQRSNADNLKKDISRLGRQLQDLKDQIADLSKSCISATDIKQKEKDAAEIEAAETEARQKEKLRIAAIAEMNRLHEEKRKLLEQQQLQEQPIVKETAIENTTEEKKPQLPLAAKETWYEKWLRNNPDLEKFIGENLFNKIGIAVLVFGIGFFVKYAIDKDWINEYGRVSIGIVCGITLIGLAHYLRKNYRSFSSVLAGGGVAVFYFTIALAFHQYNVIGQTPAFILMVVITAFAVALALLYNKAELAVIAAVGGFLTPFLVSTGQGNYIVLFTYLIILNIGLLALSYFKKWPLINILSLFFTIIIYGGWLINTFVLHSEVPPYNKAFLFATIFYLIFLGMNMVHNISRQKPFKAFDFFILLLINFTYYAAGMFILSYLNNGDYKGLFTIAMGVVNFVLAFYFFRTQKADKNLLYLLIGLTFTYLSLAAPVQLHGHSITLFWCAETVLLFWLYQRSQIKLFKISSVIIGGAMAISLFMDWQFADPAKIYSQSVIFTDIKGIVTNIVAIAALILYTLLLRKEQKNSIYLKGIFNRTVYEALVTAALALIYTTCFFGINLFFGKEPVYTLPGTYHGILNNVFVLLLMFFLFRKLDSPKILWLQMVLISACFIFYFASYSLIVSLRDGVLAGRAGSIHLLMHWVSDLSLLFLFYKGIQLLRKNFTALQPAVGALGWAFSFMIVYTISFECLQLYVTALGNANDIYIFEQQYLKAGLTILWGISSFVMMWLGMKHKYKPLRIISLALFAMALIKLFFFDISNIGPGGKIAAFILLGILLLAVSFMYQRLKKLLIDDKAE